MILDLYGMGPYVHEPKMELRSEPVPDNWHGARRVYRQVLDTNPERMAERRHCYEAALRMNRKANETPQ